jgi:hypothetical protein
MPDFENSHRSEGMDPGTAARHHNDHSLATLEAEMACYREWVYELNQAVKLAEYSLERNKDLTDCNRKRIVNQIRADEVVRDRLMDRRAGLEAYWTWQRGEVWSRVAWELQKEIKKRLLKGDKIREEISEDTKVPAWQIFEVRRNLSDLAKQQTKVQVGRTKHQIVLSKRPPKPEKTCTAMTLEQKTNLRDTYTNRLDLSVTAI